MQQKINYTILGVLVVSLSVVMVAFFFWLYSGYEVLSYRTYELYTSNIGALEVDQGVRYSGVKVGHVENISIPDPREPNRVRVLFRVENNIAMTTTTFATVRQSGVTGPAYLSLKTMGEVGLPLKIKPGQIYPEVSMRMSGLSQIIAKLPKITENIEKSSGGLSQILTKVNADNVSATVKNIKDVSRVFALQQEKINQIVIDLQYTMSKTKKTADELPVVVEKVQKTLDSIKKLSVSSDHVMSNFSQQSLPQFSELLQRLNGLTVKVNQLTSQLQHQPSSLIRGRSIVSLGPGEV